jgi:hypothetical protein
MNEFEINTEISAGKKAFKVVSENEGYTLMESGSIVAVIKKKEGNWTFTQGSYSEEDAKTVGKLIEQNINPI